MRKLIAALDAIVRMFRFRLALVAAMSLLVAAQADGAACRTAVRADQPAGYWRLESTPFGTLVSDAAYLGVGTRSPPVHAAGRGLAPRGARPT